ncbi:Type I site-specific deoxyribonuclease [Tenacibaculum sp. 190524A02b]|uniref:type I restriction endonuclease subunit R n=1 Tax=Tenacibaculum vairaonense TaxID=3137860 RepID=UPI0032B27266
MNQTTANQTPEQKARDIIDIMLYEAGWLVQSKEHIDLSAGKGIALRETNTISGAADYVLYVNRKPIGVIEAKKEEEGHRLTTAEEQSIRYANEGIKIGSFLLTNEKPFVYESTGIITRFRDIRDPKPKGRRIFSFHTPEALAHSLKQGNSLRQRLQNLPKLLPDGLRKAQIKAITNLETSFKNNKQKALIQMATGAGKTFTAATFSYRLLKHAKAKRILFLVDTKNLGEQAEQEFLSYQPIDDNRKFTELYNVQRLSGNYIAPDSHVCISTIQRLYSILKGEELDEADEIAPTEENTWMQQKLAKKEAAPVAYTPNVPIETFDFVVIDECHRSIYNLWKQVLDYFDAFLIGLTATPDNRTFGFFEENVVSEYTLEESVIDGVNVDYQVYNIETDISKKGGIIESGWYVDRRDKLTRKKRWQQEDEDTSYTKNDLDKKVVNPSQIRNIIREYKRVLQTTLFPKRFDKNGVYEVPKTLVFAKTDSHADDIIKIIRDEFNEGDDFCKKLTYKIKENPKSVLNRFRNNYEPRIAVTVDMIATGTDVKALEVLLFMRDVKSKNYFEQMKGRGTRTIDSDSLQKVTKEAKNKTHFIIVDAVGATKSKKTTSRSLERKPTIGFKALLDAVKMGVTDEDLFLSLANRLLRLEKQISNSEKEKIVTLTGKTIPLIAQELLNAYDLDKLDDASEAIIKKIPREDHTPALYAQTREQVQEELLEKAASNFTGEFCTYIEDLRKQNEQIIDHINIDTVTKSEWDTTSISNANEIVSDFSSYLEEHKDQITALNIYYNQPHNRRNVTFAMLKEVLDKLKADKPLLAPQHVWDAYTQLEIVKGKQPLKELTILVSLLRRVCGIDNQLQAYDKVVDDNFKTWMFQQNAGQHNRFTPEQVDWLRLIKEHIKNSYHIETDDLDYTPFDAQGGRGKMHQLFGEQMNEIMNELNNILAA